MAAKKRKYKSERMWINGEHGNQNKNIDQQKSYFLHFEAFPKVTKTFLAA